MEKNDIVTVRITDLTSDGEGIGKADSFPLFIKDAAVGDIVEAKIMKLKRTYGYARIVHIVEASPDRCAVRCEKARVCGGCQLQQMTYEAELLYKQRKVAENLRRIGGFRTEIAGEDSGIPMDGARFEAGRLFYREGNQGAGADGLVFREGSQGAIAGGSVYGEGIRVLPALGMDEPWRYRNKAQVPVGTDRDGKLMAGFYAAHSHDIVGMEDCALAFPEARAVQCAVIGWMNENRIQPYDEATHQGTVRHLLIRKGFSTGEVMLCLVVFPNEMKRLRGALPRLVADVKKIAGYRTLCLNTNELFGNVILGERTETVDGPGFIEDYIGEVRFRISPQSFFQVNPAQTNILYGKAMEFAGLTGQETVWDLYCGIGTISLFLAQKAKKVYGVEIVPQAIEDAKQNAELNGIRNAEFFVGAAEEVLPRWYAEHPDEKIDIVCVDPPRKGCDAQCLATIGAMAPERIVYVSCDSATLARDLRILTDRFGYRVEKVQPVDMFPKTVHVETVVLLSQQRPNDKIRAELDLTEFDITAAEKVATYQEIKDYIFEKHGVKVSSLYIAQVKGKLGIKERENYSLPKNADSKQPQCPKEKEKMIVEALRHFKMILE